MKRKLNPRICRGCGKVFQPTTALQRYGTLQCKADFHLIPPAGRKFQSRAVPGAKINHRA